MGSDGGTKGGMDCERPRRQVTLERAVYLDVHEVTNRAYGMFLSSPAAKSHAFCHTTEPKAKDHTPAAPTAEERTWGAVADPFAAAGRADHPVVGVDWYDAYAFANWLGRRLPTEVEQERAARGVDGRRYPWGSERPRAGGAARANGHWEDGFPMTAPVGSFPAGAAACGAMDLAGNVWEWTGDLFYAYEGAPEGTPEDGSQYVIRGGGWNSPSAFLMRGAMRVGRDPGYRSAALGFRTVSDEHVPAEAE
jgi:formylglycine-generating enzyme required for sulfatase activity